MDNPIERETYYPTPGASGQTTPTRRTSAAGPSRLKKTTEFRRQSKSIIYNVYKYLKLLVDNDGEVLSSTCTLVRKDLKEMDVTDGDEIKNCSDLLPEKTTIVRKNLGNVQAICAAACGVGLRTVQRVCREGKSPSFFSPRKNVKQQSSVTKLDDFDRDVVRRTVHEFYDSGEYPTSEKVRKKLIEKINFTGSARSVRRILNDIGFKYRRQNDGRRFLLERNDIVASRLKFLRKMNSLRTSGDTRPIFYLDESWVTQNHSLKYIWQSSSQSGGLKVPIGKGARLIVLHVGSAKTGFLQGSKLVYKCSKTNKSEDYHSEMNTFKFKDWFLNSFLNLLEEGSIVVMDNAKYHSAVLNRAPTTKTLKADIAAWLQDKKIPYSPAETRAEMLEKVRMNREEPVYELDVLANEMGHEVVRLPPYHCQYNPIELIWAQVKREVAEKNKSFKIADVERLLHEALENVTIEQWRKCVEHAEKLQKEDFEKEVVRDNTIEPIIINLNDDSTTSEDKSSVGGGEDESTDDD